MDPIRILTAVPICDGHDSAINTINLELVRNGVEVVYLGYNRSARDIARAAVQEDVVAVGISTYNGGHIEFFAEVKAILDSYQVQPEIRLFGGGGGTITREDARTMYENGVDRIFFAGTPLDEMVDYVKSAFVGVDPSAYPEDSCRTIGSLSRRLTLAENERTGNGAALVPADKVKLGRQPKVIGFTGPGGAGKTTLIDELVLRFLRAFPEPERLAILSHDPSISGSGALLGDRATMIYSQDERVFMRSIATRGQAGGISHGTVHCLQQLMREEIFSLILVETVGTGQEAMPFGQGLVNETILVMPPDYGSRLQLQKIAMLDLADLIVVNKSDVRGARTAAAEIEYHLRANKKKQTIFQTQANKHRDPEVDRLFERCLGPKVS